MGLDESLESHDAPKTQIEELANAQVVTVKGKGSCVRSSFEILPLATHKKRGACVRSIMLCTRVIVAMALVN